MEEANYRGVNGHWLTKALFLEEADDDSRVLYTLRDKDVTLPSGKRLPSLKRLYLEASDPTEYLFATLYLGGWSHWKQLSNNTLRSYAEEWREELDIKLKSEAMSQLKELADSGDRMAAQFIAKQEYKEKRKAGAPSKEEKEGAVKAHLAATDLSEYRNRIKK